MEGYQSNKLFLIQDIGSNQGHLFSSFNFIIRHPKSSEFQTADV